MLLPGGRCYVPRGVERFDDSMPPLGQKPDAVKKEVGTLPTPKTNPVVVVVVVVVFLISETQILGGLH